MVQKKAGFDILYPDGCAEINGSLRADELRKRINVRYNFKKLFPRTLMLPCGICYVKSELETKI